MHAIRRTDEPCRASWAGVSWRGESAGQSLCPKGRGGKSGLRRTGCQVTPGGREPTESATENKPPKRASAGKGEKVR